MKALSEQLKIFNSLPSFNKFWNISKQYYQNNSKFNGVYSRKKLPKIKDRAYVINLDKFKSIGTHKISSDLYLNANSIIYFESFGVEHTPKEI